MTTIIQFQHVTVTILSVAIAFIVLELISSYKRNSLSKKESNQLINKKYNFCNDEVLQELQQEESVIANNLKDLHKFPKSNDRHKARIAYQNRLKEIQSDKELLF